jgi:ABC-type sugar transport system substrate-binding protein
MADQLSRWEGSDAFYATDDENALGMARAMEVARGQQ